VSSISPNQDYYEWDAAKDKLLAKNLPGNAMINEKIERISEKIIEKRINPELISRRNLP
jgi:hypothetical protein